MKLRRNDSRMLNALHIIASESQESYVVGGAVRDCFLQNDNRVDIDVAVRGDGFEIAKRVAGQVDGSFVPLDKRHGTGRIAFGERGATELDVSSFKGPSIIEDLMKRDFTINAMALRVNDYITGSMNNVIDPCDGRKDLNNGVIRVCSDDAFEDDPLRMIRAFRFSATLGFQISSHTTELIARHSEKITGIAGERIRDECMIMFAQSRCLESLKAMDRAGLFDLLFEELTPMKGLEQNYYHHLAVWDHVLEALHQFESLVELGEESFGELWSDIEVYLNEELVVRRPRKALLKLAILYHDAGKPQTISKGTDHRIHFFGHEQVSKSLFENAAVRLKLAGRETQTIAIWIKNHMRPIFLSAQLFPKRGTLKLNRKCGRDVIGLYLLYLADMKASRGPARSIEEDSHAISAVKTAIRLYFDSERTSLVPLLRGTDIIQELNLKPGPYIGFLLREVFDLQVQGIVQTREEALASVQRIIDRRPYDAS